MKTLLTLTLVLLIGCSSPTAPTCEEYELERIASYNGIVSYIFDVNGTNLYLQSHEPLNLKEGDMYCIEYKDGYIISIH